MYPFFLSNNYQYTRVENSVNYTHTVAGFGVISWEIRKNHVGFYRIKGKG